MNGESALAFMVGLLLGSVLTATLLMSDYRRRYEGVGIDKIVKCSFERPNVCSNWYEIVWKDGKKR